MSSLKKVVKPIEYEVHVKVYCPHCAASEKGKEIGIMLPARSLPSCIRCFNCEGIIPIKNIFTVGKEKITRECKDEKIKGIL